MSKKFLRRPQCTLQDLISFCQDKLDYFRRICFKKNHPVIFPRKLQAFCASGLPGDLRPQSKTFRLLFFASCCQLPMCINKKGRYQPHTFWVAFISHHGSPTLSNPLTAGHLFIKPPGMECRTQCVFAAESPYFAILILSAFSSMSTCNLPCQLYIIRCM